MRIERLHFKNINSLKGEWTIDFTDPALSASGLFLITGDTGSGKSSILDAITIALYGKTPRIDRFSKTANEVMTRHTEECFAELLFSSGAHQYVARFEQRRARGKKDGNLQNPSYYFEDKENNQVYTKYNDVSRKVVDVTGMTYEQFTTSVLLAQGQFTEFLKSKVDDRARILEQITGTEIYSKISINVFEKYKKENLVLSELKTQVEGIEILSDEDRQAYVAKTENLRNTSALLEKEIEKLREDEEYLKRVKNSESRYQEALNLFSEAKIKLEHFNEENQERLLADAKAQSLAGTHSSLKELRETSANTKKSLESEIQNLPLYEDKFTETSRLLSAAEEALNAHNKLVAEQQIIFDKVIEIDSRLSEQQKSRDSAKSEYESKKQQCEDQKAELSLKIAEKKALEKESSEINKQLSDNTIFARLENDLSGIREKLNALSEAGQAHDKALTSLSQREQALEHSDKNIAALKKDLDEALEELNKAESKYQNVKTELEKLTEDSSVEKLRDLSFAFDNLLSKMEKTQGQLKALSDLEAELQENSQNSKTKNKELMPLTEALGSFRRELENTEHLIEITDQNFRFSEAFKNLEGIRSSLEEGKPCPCCGSTVHPFAANLPKLEDKLEKTLTDLKEQRKLLGTKIQKTEAVINTRQGELNSLKAAYDSLLSKKTELLSQISSG
ncbi:MAG: ATP-binding protein, partial [Succinivibrio dextrinosolvens]|nr:ATP-binding protein [Succinivibrio dextrinosolvens]